MGMHGMLWRAPHNFYCIPKSNVNSFKSVANAIFGMRVCVILAGTLSALTVVAFCVIKEKVLEK